MNKETLTRLRSMGIELDEVWDKLAEDLERQKSEVARKRQRDAGRQVEQEAFDQDREPDTMISCEVGSDGYPTGNIGTRFEFQHDRTIDPALFDNFKQLFYQDLDKSINKSARDVVIRDKRSVFKNKTSRKGKKVRIQLNLYDTKAPLINVVFGSAGTSSASPKVPEIFINVNDLSNPGSVLHEWLHIAGLIDRYYEFFYFDFFWEKLEHSPRPVKTIVTIFDRVITSPIQYLPEGYDDDYNPETNAMSVAGTDITNQQWELILYQIDEYDPPKSLGLGRVSVLVEQFDLTSTGPLEDPGFNNADRIAKRLSQATEIMNKLAFSSTQAKFVSNLTMSQFKKQNERGFLVPPRSDTDFSDMLNPAKFAIWILHTTRQTYYPTTNKYDTRLEYQVGLVPTLRKNPKNTFKLEHIQTPTLFRNKSL